MYFPRFAVGIETFETDSIVRQNIFIHRKQTLYIH